MISGPPKSPIAEANDCDSQAVCSASTNQKPCNADTATEPSRPAITKTHSGSFSQGQVGATYTVTFNVSASLLPCG